MSANTSIEWCDHTFNPWVGCTKVSPGCDHCYAEGWAKRAGKAGVIWGGERRRTSEANWRQPMRWNAIAAAGHFVECSGCGRRGDARTWEDDIRRKHPQAITCCPDRKLVATRPRVFCASLADVFDNQVQAQWRKDLFELIRMTPHLDWLLLTKRIGMVTAGIESVIRTIESNVAWGSGLHQPHEDLRNWLADWMLLGKAPANVWIGAAATNQSEADRDIPKLLAVPAARRFLSIEPMLGAVSLDCWPVYGEDERPLLHWVICGGESGPRARPMHPDWPRSLRDQCAAAGVPFLFKQWGEFGTGFQRSNGIPVFRAFDTFDQWVCKASTWVAGGICLDRHGAQMTCGADMSNAWKAGNFPVTIMHKVGKKAAGRLLDGREHTSFPGSAAS